MQVPYLSEMVLRPWEEHPYELVTWLEMLQFSAKAFFWCGGALQNIRADCLVASAVALEGGEVAFAMPREIDEKERQKTISSLALIRDEFAKIGLTITSETVKELIQELEKEIGRSCEWLITQTRSVERLAQKELNGKFFLYIPPERAKFWPKTKQPNVFGDEVATKFHSATFDIENGGVCLAVMMSTASVFHMMRVLEIGLGVLGAKFGVSLAHTNWAPAIEQIESKIRNMHKDSAWRALADCKEQQEFYAQAASHFAILKDAWRNHTMHARGKYTEPEAERIFENVKGFMQKLAERLSE